MISIDDIAAFCRRRGFVYPNSEIYGGLAGIFDYGPVGVELKNNIKKEWWKFHVQSREDTVGIDGSIISHPKIWKASGHSDSFEDIMVEDSKTKELFRADLLVEEFLKESMDGKTREELWKLIQQHKIKSHKGNELSKPKGFNLMFSTDVGPKNPIKAYLRPETAQLIFTNFKLITENSRLKLPFGIAQIGKAFRNEIAPRNFLFRCREFEQMEIEYFTKPKETKCKFINEVEDYKLKIYSAEMQEKGSPEIEMTIKQALSKKIFKNEWHAYWLATEHKWFISLGINKDNLRIRQHNRKELAHYSSDCWDLEYKFPFGFKEVEGIADRSDYDLKQHIEHSKKDLSLFDDELKQKIVPYVVAEPSLGVDRAFLIFLFEAYEYNKERENVVLKLHPKLSPIKVGIFPLVKNKPQIVKKAREVYDFLKNEFVCDYDDSGSIGRRYSRQDEIGTFLGCTIDFETLKDKSVTLRDRDTTKQIRVKIDELKEIIKKLINEEIKFEKAGKLIK